METQHSAANTRQPILVTGATGLVGAHVVKLLLEKGFSVRALKRKSSSFILFEEAFGDSTIASQVEWVNGDVLDINTLLDAMQGVQYVYHCAAMVSFDGADAQKMLKTNEEGTANVVNMALEAGVQKLCHVSSIASLGRNTKGNLARFIDENNHWQSSSKNSMYAISKYGGEREVWRGIAEGLDAVIVNPGIIIGPGNWQSGSSKTFSTVWKGLKYYTLGKNAFVDVRDVARAMVTLTHSDIRNERFLLTAENFCYKDFFFMIADALGCPRPNTRATPFMSELVWRIYAIKRIFTEAKPLITKETARTANQVYEYSSEKIKKAIGFEFIPVKEAINYTAQRFLATHIKK